MDINELILQELREHRAECNKNFTELRERMTAVETKIEPMFDNGQPRNLNQPQQPNFSARASIVEANWLCWCCPIVR